MNSSKSSTGTSSDATASPTPDLLAPRTGRALRDGARFALRLLRRHGLRLSLAFAGVLLPLWGFAELAEDVHERELIPFDEPILRSAHELARAGLDQVFLLASMAGYGWGVVPVDIVLVLALTLRRRLREGSFAALALAGSALLNVGAKHVFARARPALWTSIAPEYTYSFPSGHAMGSATLAWVLAMLAWRTRWRWPVAIAMTAFVVVVGLSRVYLGVHYPSDILAGWAAASTWAVACYLIVFRRVQPWAARVGAVTPPA